MTSHTASSIPDPVTPRRLGLSRSTNVSIRAADGRKIAGTLDFPAGIGSVGALPEANLPTAIVVHCFTCNRKSRAASLISKSLARMGYLSLRIDMEGLGDSDGDMENSTLSRQIDDVLAAGRWLDKQSQAPEPSPGRILIGHSLGGAAVLRAAPRMEEVRAVVTIGTPFDPSHVTATMPKVEQKLRQDPSVSSVEIPGRNVRLGRVMLDDLEKFCPADDVAAVGNAGIASLFIHPPADELVPYDQAEQLYNAAVQPKSLISIPEADHLLQTPGTGQRVAELIALWAQAYMGARRINDHDY